MYVYGFSAELTLDGLLTRRRFNNIANILDLIHPGQSAKHDLVWYILEMHLIPISYSMTCFNQLYWRKNIDIIRQSVSLDQKETCFLVGIDIR